MRPTLLIVLAVALASPATVAHTQEHRASAGSLPAFRSDVELEQFVLELAKERKRHLQAARECTGGGEFVRSRARSRAAPKGGAIIRGRVTNEAGTRLPGAKVALIGLSGAMLSEDGGEYHLRIPEGRLTAKQEVMLSAAYLGFTSRQLELALSPGDSVVVDFALCESVEPDFSDVGIAGASVPNVQREGVDEGGIVKVHGDHLVLLRRGRLFTVVVGSGRLDPVSAVDAFGPDVDPRGTGYDEMLVSGDNVVVIGFSYAGRRTEIGLFKIDAGGKLSYRATYHLRSSDYYSSRYYSSRLVGSRLVLYTALPLRFEGVDLAASLPAMRRWHAGARDDDFRPILSASRVYRPGAELDPLSDIALHTVTTCDLARAELTCEATSVIGPRGRVFYASPAAAYVWVSDWPQGRRPVEGSSMLYRIPLDGTAPGALGVDGSPVNQFSFLESDDGHINVLVRNRAAGDAMGRAERASGDVSLLRVPFKRFSDGRAVAARSAYRALPAPADRGDFENRFAGKYLLYGVGTGWGKPERAWYPDRAEGTVLYAVGWAGGPTTELSLPHGIDRIEVMGRDAVVVGADLQDLHFTGIDLGALPSVVQRYVRPGASRGQLRGHGFFYSPDGADSGILGLTIRAAGRPGYDHLRAGTASMLFLQNADATFRELGELAARSDNLVDDGCVASCVDWYGNARPLFLEGRIFALLGYEIVEGALRDGRIHEVRRASFAPRGAENLAR
jgi:hypothetical protein